MEHVKILLVDDEKYESVLIARCVNWAQFGFEIVGAAQTAQEALSLFRQKQPDIVFCDINMPVMNGLELCRRMKALRPATRLLIVTGYRDFEYAKQAIQIGVEDYILKPIQADELLKAAQKIRSVLAPPELPTASDAPVRNELIQKAVRFIEDHLSVRGLSLRMIAPALYVNGSYLSRVFKESTGENITSYILRRRIEKSQELFDTTDLRVYEVAALVGMPDAHYFGQCFKRFTGKTVNEYRAARQETPAP